MVFPGVFRATTVKKMWLTSCPETAANFRLLLKTRLHPWHIQKVNNECARATQFPSQFAKTYWFSFFAKVFSPAMIATGRSLSRGGIGQLYLFFT